MDDRLSVELPDDRRQTTDDRKTKNKNQLQLQIDLTADDPDNADGRPSAEQQQQKGIGLDGFPVHRAPCTVCRVPARRAQWDADERR
ncbi:MAG: hypothetical protein ABIL58_04580 [Pseudomonadota bacterium]